MVLSVCTEESTEHLANLRRLLAWRWIVLAILVLLVLMVPGMLDIPVPQVPLLGIIVVALLFNAIVQWRTMRSQTASTGELFTQLLFDIGTLSAIVFFSGGATNPLVSLLLPPVAVAALTLPARCVAIISATTIVAYSALMVYFIPLQISDATRATRLHLIGMWLIFVISAAIIGWVIVRMTRQIRERDAELAPAPALNDAAREDIALLRQQIGVCKQIITGLSRRAGAERLENAARLPIDQWLENLRQHLHASRPQANSRLMIDSAGEPPRITG